MCDECSEKIFSPYMTEEVPLKKRTPFHAQLAIFRLKSWKMLAHHPTCSRYSDHYFRVGKISFCVGCSMIYSAVILYAILFFAVPAILWDLRESIFWTLPLNIHINGKNRLKRSLDYRILFLPVQQSKRYHLPHIALLSFLQIQLE